MGSIKIIFMSKSDEDAIVSSQHRRACSYPQLVVFDLDACLWNHEMYLLRSIPCKVSVGELGIELIL